MTSEARRGYAKGRAKSESDEYQWKKLIPGSTYLDVEYNHPPGVPGSLAFSHLPRECSSAPERDGASIP